MSTKKIVFGVSVNGKHIVVTNIGLELPFVMNGSFDDLKLHIGVEENDIILVKGVNVGNNNVGVTPGIHDIYFLKDIFSVSKSLALKDFGIPNANYPLLSDLLVTHKTLFEQV